MFYRAPTRTTTRRIPRILLAGLPVVIAPIIGALAYQRLASSPSSAIASSPVAAEPLAHRPHDIPRKQHPGPSGEADGVVPEGVTVFDGEYPAVANLDPALLHSLRQAARDAAGDGVELCVDSGWRSPRYQEQLLEQAIAKYGSRAKAAEWVATPATSAHVSGNAVDIGHADATTWLSEHGAEYGLCQIYANEPWHYELRPEAMGQGCPAMYADPTHDPRMQR